VSADAIDLISRMLTVDAAKRISVNDALKHPWINTQDAELKSRNLDSNQATLRRYLAKRRFKKAILAHVAVGRFKKGLSQLVARRGSADNNDDFELSPEVVLPVVEEY
jgi:serine/threonine protein kinase